MTLENKKKNSALFLIINKTLFRCFGFGLNFIIIIHSPFGIKMDDIGFYDFYFIILAKDFFKQVLFAE